LIGFASTPEDLTQPPEAQTTPRSLRAAGLVEELPVALDFGAEGTLANAVLAGLAPGADVAYVLIGTQPSIAAPS